MRNAQWPPYRRTSTSTVSPARTSTASGTSPSATRCMSATTRGARLRLPARPRRQRRLRLRPPRAQLVVHIDNVRRPPYATARRHDRRRRMHKRAAEKSVCRLPAHMDDVAYGAESTADTAARPPGCFPVPKTRRSSRAHRSDKERAATPSAQRDIEVHTRCTVRRKNSQRLPSPAAHTLVSSTARGGQARSPGCGAQHRAPRRHHTRRASKASRGGAGTTRMRRAKNAGKRAATQPTAHGGMTRGRRVYRATAASHETTPAH
ncbi:hypothetical protein C8J57DRAFT_1600219 [Mycena rebaudengoi]|nr:hypothetical protein C8J57DRAFT_1600219 [Mycena rebaudengoi]